MTGRALFRHVAPRLERAHRERRQELRREAVARHVAREVLMAAEWRVAHRELQLVRNLRAKTSYVERRQRLLDQAREELARALEHAERIGAVPIRRRRAA